MHMQQEQWHLAEQVYEKLVKNYPGAYAGYFFLGRINAIKGRSEDSPGPISKKRLILEPELVESRFELGALYESNKEYKKAAVFYN
jgi:hypothetical protein